MRHDSDFAAYVAARWPVLVRTLVLLGCPAALADDVATAALARARSSWGRIRDDDPDAAVYRTLLETWADRRRTTWWVGLPDAPRLPVEDVLDRLVPDTRARLVLAIVAGLGPAQVDEAVGGSSSARGTEATVVEGAELRTEEIRAEEIRAAAESVGVSVAPLPETVAARGPDRPRRAPRGGAVLLAAVLVVVVATATWLGTRPEPTADPDALAPATVERAENPAGVVWFENDTLHLAHVLLDLPDVSDLTTVGGSAVYGDASGRVVLVDVQGDRTTLGHKSPRERVVSSEEDGWVAWVDPRGDVPELFVYEVASRDLLGRRALPADGADAAAGETAAIAVDGGRVYWRDADGVHVWQLSDNSVAGDEDGLLDVESRTRVYQVDGATIRMQQPLFDVTLDRPGRGAQLSSDGNYVLTRPPDGGGEAGADAGTVIIYDTRDGSQVPTGLTADDYAVAAELGPDRTASYVVARRQDRPKADDYVRVSFFGPMELRTCSFDDPGPPVCELRATFPGTGQTPLLSD